MKIIMLIVALFLSGCVSHNVIPAGYKGGIAQINDTFIKSDRDEVDLFYVKAVNGSDIVNASHGTSVASSGNLARPIGHVRDVPTELMDITIVGTRFYSSPLSQVISNGKSTYLEGTVSFRPEPDRIYTVRGALDGKRSMVWLESSDGHVSSPILYLSASGGVESRSVSSGDNLSPRFNATKEGFFANISGGETSDLIEVWIGEPDEVSERKSNIFGRVPYTRYIYKDFGEIRFLRFHRNLYVHQVLPDVSKLEGISAVKLQLENSASETLQKMAINYYSVESVTVEEMDLFADKIWEERRSSDAYMTDALSWFCKVIGKSESSRYREFLGNIADDEKVPGKLKRYAKSSLKLLAKENVDQYIPGM